MCMMILVHAHEVEPLVLLHTRLEELDITVPPGVEQALITNVAETIESEFGAALLK